MHTRKIELGFFFFVAAVAATLSFFILKPYLGALFVALVFALVFRPIHERILRAFKRPGLSALSTLAILFLAILIPATAFSYFVFDDAQKLYVRIASGAPVLEPLDQFFEPVERSLQRVFPATVIKPSTYLTEALSFFVGNFGSVFSRIVSMVFQTFIMLLALFYLLRDGPQFKNVLVRLSPLQNEYDERILKRLEHAIGSVVKGKLLIILIQGILASLGFYLFGVPHPVLWGALTSLAALIPALGVAVVFIPIVIYTFIVGGIGGAVGLLIFGVAIGALDNILGPVFFERGLQMHPLLILLSILGGLVFFGPVGFLAGPVTLSFLLALLDIYPLLFAPPASS